MTLAARILSFLREMAYQPAPVSVHKPTQFVVDYYAVTPKGSSSHFTRTSGVSQMRNNAHSETAVRAYLQRLHPKCEIQINDLQFR